MRFFKQGDLVYVVEPGYLVEERVAALCAGEVGLAVSFECYVDSARVHVTDQNGVLWEIPPAAICAVPEGHVADVYKELCPACGLRLFLRPQQFRDAIEDDGVIRPYRPPIKRHGSE
jgi:hypothetical protein